MSSKSTKYRGPYYGPFFFLVNKPVGLSSFDIIRNFKRNLSKKIGKIGHFGTLDPFADGLMLIGIGGATRLNDLVQDYPKTYIATGKLGVKSPTGDMTVEDSDFVYDDDYQDIDEAKILQALNEFKGNYLQVPHVFSAVKIDGRPSYELARQGIEIKKEAVERFVYDIKLLEVNESEVRFEVTCSSGTYIRVLFEDLASKLGTFGVLSKLHRSSVGHLKNEQALDISSFEVENFDEVQFLSEYAKNLNDLIAYPTIELGEVESDWLRNGRAFKTPNSNGFYWARSNGKICALLEVIDNIATCSVNYFANETINFRNLDT